MSFESALARIGALQATFAPAPTPAVARTTASSPTSAASFAGLLPNADATGPSAATAPLTTAPVGGGTSAGRAILDLVRGELGQAEQPPGSNNSPRIAQYRRATAGSAVGPWCAYFVSWAAREAGVPLGDAAQGSGRVDDVYAWAERTGKAIRNSPSVTPQPGDLIVWDEHIGVVDSVDADGTIHTIEGNSSDRVSQRTYGRDGGGAIGYVRLG